MVSPAQDLDREPMLVDVINLINRVDERLNDRINEQNERIDLPSKELNQRDVLQKEILKQTNKWQDRSFLLLRWGIGPAVGLSLSAAGTVLGFALKTYFPD